MLPQSIDVWSLPMCPNGHLQKQAMWIGSRNIQFRNKQIEEYSQTNIASCKYCNQVHKRPDVVHVFSLQSWMAPLGMHVCQFSLSYSGGCERRRQSKINIYPIYVMLSALKGNSYNFPPVRKRQYLYYILFFPPHMRCHLSLDDIMETIKELQKTEVRYMK